MNIRTTLKAALFGLALASPAMADQLADMKAAGKIVTATDMHYAPFDMVVDGTITWKKL